jgi:hypothetical protein
MQRFIIIIDFEVVVVNSQGEKRIRSYTSGCVQVWRLTDKPTSRHRT